MKFERPVKINGIQFNHNKFQMLEDGVEMKPERITYEKGYSRENKPNKKTVYSEIKDCDINIYSVLEKYDYLIGIDTNTRPTEYGKYSATGVIISQIINCQTHIELLPIQAIGKMLPYFYKEHPRELVGLFLFVKSFVQNILIDYSTAKGILIIIDHNLDRIDEYNERKIPLTPGIEESYLPPKIYLMYASSDKKNITVSTLKSKTVALFFLLLPSP